MKDPKKVVLQKESRSGHPERFPVIHPHLLVKRVDLFDSASLADALTDSDVVVNATGDHSADVHAFFVNSTKALIEGVQRVGSKRLIVVGGAGSLEVAPGIQLASVLVCLSNSFNPDNRS